MKWSKKLFWVPAFLAYSIYTGLITKQAFAPKEYAPLGEYSIQKIENTTGEDHPVVYSDQDVSRLGTKCNNTNHDVPVQGKLFWQTIDPLGGSILIQQGVGIRHPGCETLHYTGSVPQEVIDRTRQLLKTNAKVIWRITGIETPTDHAKAVSKIWVSDNFELRIR